MEPVVTEKGNLVTVSLGGGKLHATKRGSVLTIVSSEAETRGRGQGIKMYSALMHYAAERGLTIHSDVTVEDGAVHVWQALQRRGFPIRQNPQAQIEPLDEPDSFVMYVDLKTPVFTARPSSAAGRVATRFLLVASLGRETPAPAPIRRPGKDSPSGRPAMRVPPGDSLPLR